MNKDNTNANVKDSVDKIFKLLRDKGSADYIGEQVTQIEHMIQSAMLAEEYGYSNKKIMAALLHDIGHLVDGAELMYYGSNKTNLGVLKHEIVGADLLRSYNVDEYVCDLVENHPNAKRYLVTVNKDYADNLSNASKKTLAFQGGSMNPMEMEKFINSPNFNDYIDLRKIDELAKEKDKKIKDLEYYRQMCESCITS
jgi:putative nucleotidyltransferase with HDIG domain